VSKPGTASDGADNDDEDEDEDEDANELAAKKAKLASSQREAGQTLFDAKFEALIELVNHVREEDETSKVLIFSQFGTTITMLQAILPQRGYQYRTLTGDMTRAQRGKALRDFQKDPNTTVFLSECCCCRRRGCQYG